MSSSDGTSGSESEQQRKTTSSSKSKKAEKFKPNKSFREVPLRRALKSFIVSTVIESYVTMAIRVLWKEKNFSDMYVRREQLEKIFKDTPQIKMAISCVTAMERGEETDTGFCFWLAYDWPEITVNKFENLLCKKIIDTGVKIDSCKRIRARGMCYFIFTKLIYL